MGWQDDQIVAPAQQKQPWENDAIVYSNGPRAASGVVDAIQAGYQGSAVGLAARGKLPDVQLDPQHSKWYERLAAGGTQLAAEFPLMVAGGLGGTAAGGAAGTAVAPGPGTVVGGLVGGGAGAFALPAAIRESYIQAYQKGEIKSTADFLERASIVLKHTGKEALIGAATAGAGKAAGLGLQTAGYGAKAVAAGSLAAEGGTLVVAPAALEGRMPEPQDFMDAAILLGGLKGAHAIGGKLMDVYAKTGKTPIEVVADAKADPTIVEDLKVGTPVAPTEYVDTRGGETRFHGTGKAIGALSDSYALSGDNRNIYGQGFYTTDALDISQGYAKKGGSEAVIYEVNHEPVKLFNMEAPIEPKADAIVKGAMGDYFPTENAETGKPLTNLREIYDEFRRESSNNGLSRNDVQDVFDAIRYSLEQEGYRGFEHIGGGNTGKTAHSVKIFWNPETDVKITPADIAKHEKQAGAAETAAPEIPRAYQEMARDENARNAVPEPSPEATKFLDKPFADVPQLPGEPILDTHVNYNYLNTTEDVKGAMSRLSQLYEQDIKTATRGKVSWEQTYTEARQLFEQATGEKAPEMPLGNADYSKLSADLYARKQILMSGAEQLMTQRAEYAKARDEGLATDQMKLGLLAQIDRVAQAQAAVRGSQAEVGRALNILKSTNRDKAYYDELTNIIDGRFGVEGKKVGDANFDTMIDMMGDMGTPAEALKFADKAAKATTWQKVVEAWKAGLVSGPFTQIANILGNVTFAATRPFVDLTSAAVGAARGNAERVSAVEPLARITGNVQGVVDGAKAAAAVFKNGGGMDGKSESYRKAIDGTMGEVIRTPFRLLSAADAFFRVANERGEAYALATREAVKEGYNPATREFRDRVVEIATNPTDKMQAEIDAAGVRFTFNSPLGEKGQAIQKTIKMLHLEWAVPFVQTPANVFKEMARLTPTAPIIGEWRADLAKGGVAADKAIAEMVMGTALGTAVFSFAISGNISGAGDPDPKKRAMQMAAGWQPYSVKVGDTWYSYQRLQPVGTLIGMAADAAIVWDHMSEDESDKIPKIMATAFANAVTNQTFLQGITSIINAMSDPTRFGPRFLQNMAGSAIPAIVGQTAQMMDPYQREVNSVLDAVRARIPLASEGLMPKRDAYGEPIAGKDRVLGISPVTTSTVSTDPVRLEAARLGVGAAKAPDHIELPSGHDSKLGKVKLTPEQQDIFADKAGHMAHQILTQMVNSPSWSTMPDMAQRNAMSKVFEVSRKAGQAAAVPPEQIQREAQRIAKELNIRLAPK